MNPARSAKRPVHCSDISVEPLPGTAKTGSGYVLLEHPGPWSHDILDGATFSPELSARLRTVLKEAGLGLQLIRKPGREGRQVGRANLFLVFAGEEVIERLQVDSPEAIFDLDLSGPGRNGAETIGHPMLLICTHGKRDVCCALKGRPLAAEVEPRFGALQIWESSHTKGHRFAPSMLLMPWNYSYGRLNAEATTTLFRHALAGELFLPGNRGRGTLDARGQVAELAVLALIDAPTAPGVLEVRELDGEVGVSHPDGRSWAVTLEQHPVEGVISSCGEEPKTGRAWVAVALRELNG